MGNANEVSRQVKGNRCVWLHGGELDDKCISCAFTHSTMSGGTGIHNAASANANGKGTMGEVSGTYSWPQISLFSEVTSADGKTVVSKEIRTVDAAGALDKLGSFVFNQKKADARKSDAELRDKLTAARAKHSKTGRSVSPVEPAEMTSEQVRAELWRLGGNELYLGLTCEMTNWLDCKGVFLGPHVEDACGCCRDPSNQDEFITEATKQSFDALVKGLSKPTGTGKHNKVGQVCGCGDTCDSPKKVGACGDCGGSLELP